MDLKITNQRIINFFNTNDDINVESFLLQNIDFYEYVASSINNNNTAQILPYILTQTSLINDLVNDNKVVKQQLSNIDHLRAEQVNTFKDLKHLVLENNMVYINNTKNIINDIQKTINSNNDLGDLKNTINSFDKRLLENNISMINSTKEIVSMIKKDSDFSFLSGELELVNNKSFNDIKNQITLARSNSPRELDHLFDKITNEFKRYNVDNDIVNTVRNIVKDEMATVKNDLNETKASVLGISNKFMNSSVKGKISENILESELSRKFPSFNISRTSLDSHCGDFIVSSLNKPSVLIENKDYDKNVNNEETNKFKRDLNDNNMSGILISQNSGIANKQNFSIDFLGDNVAIYIHNCNYDMDKIELAMDIIFSLKEYISSKGNDNTDNYIDETTFFTIENDYLAFIKNRNEIIGSLNNSIKNIKKLDVVSIKNLLNKHSNALPSISSSVFVCDICNKFFDSIQACSAHKKKHVNESKKNK